MRASLGWFVAVGLIAAAPAGCDKQARHRTLDDNRRHEAYHHRAGDHDGDGDVDERDRELRAEGRDRDRDRDLADRDRARVDDGTNSSAVRAIASARCEREARCGNLGADAKFASKEDCLDRVRADWAGELNAYACPGGLNRAELDECLGDIRGEDCGNPFDTLARTLSCSKTEICIDD
jgi:hypothetical protein